MTDGDELDGFGRHIQVAGDPLRWSGEQSEEVEVAGVWIQRFQRRPRRRGPHLQRQKVRQALQQTERIDVSEERVRFRPIAQSGEGAGPHLLVPLQQRFGPVRVPVGSGPGRSKPVAGEATHDGVGLLVGVPGERAAALRLVEPLHHLIEAGERVADQSGGHRNRTAARVGQDVLGGVQRAPHGLELDDAGGALERMESPERAVEALAVLRRVLQRQKVVGRLGDEFAALDEKLLDELVHPAGPQSSATCAIRVSGVTGLTR
jgi:hypothetical protein